MTRDEALALVNDNVKNQNLIKHMLATEAIMRALARRFGEDEEAWGLAGLLHDVDVEITNGDPSRHSKVGSEMVRKLGVSDEIANAVLRHGVHGFPRETLMDKALFCSDPLTGLITAGALVRPDKSLASLNAQSLRKRFKEKSFAAGANREQIMLCSEIGLSLEDFIRIGLEAMQGIAGDLGL